MPRVSTLATWALSIVQEDGALTSAPFPSMSRAVNRMLSSTNRLAAAGDTVNTYPESVIILGHAPSRTAAPMTSALIRYRAVVDERGLSTTASPVKGEEREADSNPRPPRWYPRRSL